MCKARGYGMDKDTVSDKFQNALGEIRRKLQKDREEAELLTQHIAARAGKSELLEG